ncbi:serine/threonine protein phosphatase 1 [Cribrihabitans marinus]|uniref:Serine/threonine protein phosphatase 1 n=1 Tax=Cribrihabitans marinus TaxID=1227549 RepID=A0A1H6XWL3_9RHOB|nr:metallophosphoesterase family protein [Cribrihabitans marinus]GGH28161.1 serine/threonine protein phosphatase [Cribrihabitans marinus]SEJ33443.1 serine/threonine protein phosphatase 1 [Cribrihabitans marinus]
MTQPIYAIGDIHGQSGMMDEALARIEADGGADARVVFLGDYTDRGPDSRGVLDRLVAGLAEGRDWIALRGNHDRMMAMFLRDYPTHDDRLLVGYHWLHERIGGAETLASYGVEVSERTRLFEVHERARAAVPQAHRRLLDDLRNHHREDGLLFVHAGIRPGIALEAQTENDLLWIRQEFHDDPRRHPWLVVHGHTPVDRARHYGNRVNLDTGAGYGRALTPAVFQDGQAWLLTGSGREKLTP